MSQLGATGTASSVREDGRAHREGRPAGLGRLLGRTFGLLIALILVSAGIAIAQGVRSSHAVDRLTGQVLPLQVANSTLITTQGDAQRGLRNHPNSAQPGFQRLYYQARAQLPGQLMEVERLASGPENAALAREIRRRLEIWLAYAGQIESMKPKTPQALQATDRALELYNQVYAATKRLQAHVTVEARALQQANQRERTLALLSVIVFAVVASVMALAVAMSAYRALIGPLRAMGDTLARLTAGEHEARVGEHGPAELRNVGRAIDQLADESDRLRYAERERTRMRQVAHELGARVRQSLDVATVMEEAVRALGERMAAHHVSLHLVHDGLLGPADMEWRAGTIREDVTPFPRVDAAIMKRAYEQNISFAGRTTELPTHRLPYAVQQTFEVMPDNAMLAVPFGSAGEPLGVLLLMRPWEEGAWRPNEVLAAEVVAGDLGHGLQQARLYQQERRLVEELRTLDLAKTDFLSTVSHELRSPLTSIVGYLELLREEDVGPLTRQQDQMLFAVERNAVRLQLLIEDLLTLSRIESGAFRSMLVPTDVSVPVSTALKTIRPLADAQGVSLEIECPEQELYVSGDLHQLERALLNLLSNAVKFTPDGGHVALRARTDGRSVFLTVSDTGMGIPQQDQPNMFTRFYRASNAVASAIPGTGLGLSIVRSIVANHAGEMRLESAEGEGTTVEVKLPKARPSASGPPGVPDPPGLPGPSGAPGTPPVPGAPAPP